MEVTKMKYKQVVKLIIDIAMYLIFVALMQEHLWDGLHEWLGIALFTLFIVHTILNFRWYQSLFKGKYTPTRTTSAVINIALFAAMLCCMVSSVLNVIPNAGSSVQRPTQSIRGEASCLSLHRPNSEKQKPFPKPAPNLPYSTA